MPSLLLLLGEDQEEQFAPLRSSSTSPASIPSTLADTT
jgi:hypothetical protein